MYVYTHLVFSLSICTILTVIGKYSRQTILDPLSPPPVYFLFQLQISGIKRVFIDEFFTFHRDLISEGTRYTFPFFPSLAIPSIDVTVCPANIRCCPTIFFFFFYLSISFHLHPDEIIT